VTTATPSNTPKQENRVVFGMFLAGAAVYVQTYDAQAILPQIGNDLVTSPTKTVLILSATTIGMAISVLPWAYISDRTGRLNTIRFSLVIAALMSIVNPFIPQFIPILAIRLFKGLFLGGGGNGAGRYVSI
jgi:YNFM family putative membrane transporter